MVRKICLAGINGYTGQLFKKIIASHPNFEVVGSLGITSDDQRDSKYTFLLNNLDNSNFDVDFLILATPADISIKIVEILNMKSIKVKILDLSGAFRLNKDSLLDWYGITHSIEGLERGAKYGLSPFVKFTQDDRVIANPGCYATCVLLSLIPLFKHKIIQPTNLVIDAKSGVSGAGKKFSQNLMFSEMVNNFFPYKIGKHQHTPEIVSALISFQVKQEELYFTTSMLPIHSGIMLTIYADLDFKGSKDKMKSLVCDAYNQEYKNYPLFDFIDISDEDDTEKLSNFLSVKNVVGTPNMRLGFSIENNKIMIFSCIDNLQKGAVTQAIENLNNYYDLPITTGL